MHTMVRIIISTLANLPFFALSQHPNPCRVIMCGVCIYVLSVHTFDGISMSSSRSRDVGIEVIMTRYTTSIATRTPTITNNTQSCIIWRNKKYIINDYVTVTTSIDMRTVSTEKVQ